MLAVSCKHWLGISGWNWKYCPHTMMLNSPVNSPAMVRDWRDHSRWIVSEEGNWQHTQFKCLFFHFSDVISVLLVDSENQVVSSKSPYLSKRELPWIGIEGFGNSLWKFQSIHSIRHIYTLLRCSYMLWSIAYASNNNSKGDLMNALYKHVGMHWPCISPEMIIKNQWWENYIGVGRFWCGTSVRDSLRFSADNLDVLFDGDSKTYVCT